MRLNQFLNEMKTLEVTPELIDLIKSKVEPDYIKMCIKAKDIPSREIMGFDYFSKLYTIEKSYENRKPTDTSKELTKLFDEAFKVIFGWKGRTNHSIFTWNISTIGCYFFPIGKYKYIYSPKIRDLWYVSDEIDALISHNQYVYKQVNTLNINNKKYKEIELNSVLDWINEKKYSDRNLENFIGKKPEFEIMFQCKEYLLISEKINVNELLGVL